ncbi:MAG: GNAT family N-acetyltransferase [Lachnotalea sp.]
MFAKAKEIGVGSEILQHLENQAQKLGYSALWLETRLINKRAV